MTLPEAGALKATSTLLQYFDAAPDGLVITEFDGRIVKANTAFIEMAQLGSAEQARGELLDRWLGRAGVDFDVALANLRQSGSIKLFSTALRGEHGATADVEVSAVSLADGFRSKASALPSGTSRSGCRRRRLRRENCRGRSRN